ncbi:Response regulator receiver domain-containing protein [Polaromonas sp. YR568]|uniref:response regulator n=1 Tax=Polaromonas sp. YR568 TaxID=1855301 RepID=UPI0008E3AD0B|nr:response regulator [Polaromonas sp. YR568]SFU30132.1 Response regulator receiver domain-containing protein [Polaromonas sp. YR568]
MTNTGGEAVKRIFVKVFGFDDAERHTLNTVFRLSETQPTAYALWTPSAPEDADIALIDGDSWEAALELANPAHDHLKLIWIGSNAPDRAILVFRRPLQWAAVVEGMDKLLARAVLGAAAGDVDLDLDLLSESTALLDLDLDVDAEAPTAPSPLDTLPPEAEQARVLVVESDLGARLYLRARLAMARLTQVDEAATGVEALKLMQAQPYKLVILDMEMPDIEHREMLKRIGAVRPAPEFLILTGSKLSPADAIRGWFAGARGSLRKPLHPGKLKRLLRSVNAG